MAIDARHLRASALIAAVEAAKDELSAPIDRIEVTGQHIYVDAGGRRIAYEMVSGQSVARGATEAPYVPLPGGASVNVVKVAGPRDIPSVANLAKRLGRRLSATWG